MAGPPRPFLFLWSAPLKMKTRIILGLIFIGLLVGIFYFDHLQQGDQGFCFLIILLMGAGVAEFYNMAGLPKRSAVLGVVCSLALQVAVWAEVHYTFAFSPTLAVLAVGILSLFLCHFSFQPDRDRLHQLSLALMGFFYVAFLGSFFVRIRALPQWGESLLLFTLVVSKGTDIFAYFTGSFFGRHKWIPKISPGKTWEGLLGGMVGAGGLGVALAWKAGGLENFYWYSVLIFCIILGLISQLGDLAESLIKRSLEVKDSAKLIPEFGGILDLIDCLLFTGPLVYFTWLFTL